MKKSSGSGDRPRPTSFFPEADLGWAMGVQPNQTPQVSWSGNRAPVLQSMPASVDLARWRRRPPNRGAMDGRIGLAAHYAARKPRASTEWAGRGIRDGLGGIHPRK